MYLKEPQILEKSQNFSTLALISQFTSFLPLSAKKEKL
jgi:hypothetical protein